MLVERAERALPHHTTSYSLFSFFLLSESLGLRLPLNTTPIVQHVAAR